MKLCLFQGTFDPIHNAHINLCEYVKQKFDFDKILVIPASVPPHKYTDLSMSAHRLKMAQLAVMDKEYLEVSDIEFLREGKSYTFLTVQELYKNYDIEGKISFIIGTDAFAKIETWYETDKLKNLVDFILFKREDEKDFVKDATNLQNLKEKGYNYTMMKMPFLDISSTQIRNNIHNSLPIKKLVPKEVEKYIDKYE